jgi:hypothetical protein
MPIEIRELVVRATLSEQAPAPGPASPQSARQQESLQAEKIAAQVAELLRKRKER